MYCQALGSQIKMCFTAVSTKWAFFLAGCCQQVDGFSSGAGTEHCVYSREASPMAPSASLLSSLRLTNSSAATSVWWSTLLRWMNLIRVTPASHFTAESAAAAALQVLSCHLVRPDRISPWRSPWRRGMEVHSPGAKTFCYPDKTAAAWLSYTVCLLHRVQCTRQNVQ